MSGKFLSTVDRVEQKSKMSTTICAVGARFRGNHVFKRNEVYELVPDPENEYDANAIMVMCAGVHVAFVSRTTQHSAQIEKKYRLGLNFNEGELVAHLVPVSEAGGVTVTNEKKVVETHKPGEDEDEDEDEGGSSSEATERESESDATETDEQPAKKKQKRTRDKKGKLRPTPKQNKKKNQNKIDKTRKAYAKEYFRVHRYDEKSGSPGL
jgi:hypothetical protein